MRLAHSVQSTGQSGLYFIKTETDLNGGANYTIIGTSQLLSVPYALYAASSGEDPIWQKNGNNIYYNGGNVGIGTTNPVELFEIHGQGVLKVLNSGALYVERYQDHVLVLRNTDTTDSNVSDIVFQRGDGSGQNGYIYTHEDNANGIDRLGFSIVGADGVFLLANGNVGINTTTPESKLTVKGGDVNILDIGSGIIMKSQNGQCWRVTIDNSGNLVRTAISCP